MSLALVSGDVRKRNQEEPGLLKKILLGILAAQLELFLFYELLRK
jgi:hypothetical protein